MESLFETYIDKSNYRLGTAVAMAAFSTYYIKHGHPLKSGIDDVLHNLADSGILLHIKTMGMWMDAGATRKLERISMESEGDRRTKISASHLTALWILAAGGIVLATIAFVSEICFESSNKMRMRYVGANDESVDYFAYAPITAPYTATPKSKALSMFHF